MISLLEYKEMISYVQSLHMVAGSKLNEIDPLPFWSTSVCNFGYLLLYNFILFKVEHLWKIKICTVSIDSLIL